MSTRTTRTYTGCHFGEDHAYAYRLGSRLGVHIKICGVCGKIDWRDLDDQIENL